MVLIQKKSKTFICKIWNLSGCPSNHFMVKNEPNATKIEVLPPDGCYVLIETSLGNMIVKLYGSDSFTSR